MISNGLYWLECLFALFIIVCLVWIYGCLLFVVLGLIVSCLAGWFVWFVVIFCLLCLVGLGFDFVSLLFGFAVFGFT